MDNQLRSSQLITTYGPGAMVELTDSSIIVGGLEGWKYPEDQACLVSEPRLAAKVTKVLRPHSTRKNAILLKSPPPPADEHRGQDASLGFGVRRGQREAGPSRQQPQDQTVTTPPVHPLDPPARFLPATLGGWGSCFRRRGASWLRGCGAAAASSWS